MEIKEKFLPIGTVVLLKGATRRIMITGFCSIDSDNREKMWDYCGCLYPEGVLSSTQSCLFNHKKKEKIYHMGLSDDEEEIRFKKNLEVLLKNAGKKS